MSGGEMRREWRVATPDQRTDERFHNELSARMYFKRRCVQYPATDYRLQSRRVVIFDWHDADTSPTANAVGEVQVGGE